MICKCCICKRCADQHDQSRINEIDPPTIARAIDNLDVINNSTNRSNDSDTESDSIITPVEQFFNNDDSESMGENRINNFLTGENRDSNINIADDFDEFVTRTDDPNNREGVEEYHRDADDLDLTSTDPLIPTTDTGEIAVTVEEDNWFESANKVHVSGHVLMNQCGSLLTRKNHEIRGSSKHRFFLQRISATSIGTSIPLLYPEAMIFPSIFWKSIDSNGSIAGALPASLLSENITQYGFESIPQHVRSRLTSFSSTTATDPRYASFSYDSLINLACTHSDTRIAVHRGLATDESGELRLRGRSDTALQSSIDGRQMVKNLCSACKYHKFSHFITLTCNQKKHFGTSKVKKWIDSENWKHHYSDFDTSYTKEINEIKSSIRQAAATLFLRIWQEVCKLFLVYMRNSPSSPYTNVLSIFVKCEYQKDAGNLSHNHLILEVNWEALNQEQTLFVQDLIRASTFDIARTDEVENLISEGVFQDTSDYHDMIKDASKFLPHICNPRCLARVGEDKYKCRKWNNLKMSKDNTKHTFKRLPNDMSQACTNRLIQIGIIQPLCINIDGYQNPFISNLSFFHPKRHIPPTNPSNDMNISPVEGYTFSVCRSMQNIQMLTGCNGVSKYICKYLCKIDEQNYVIVSTNKDSGNLVSRSTFLHNTKVSSSKANEDKARSEERDKDHPNGRAISHMEMLHTMLRYPEVVTDLKFISICTMPIELRAGLDTENSITKNMDNEMVDGIEVGIISDNIRKENYLGQ